MELMRRLCLSATVGVVGALLVGTMAALDLDDAKTSQSQATATAQAFKPVAPLLVVMENVDDIFSSFPKKFSDKSKQKDLKKDAQFLSELFNVVAYHHEEKDWKGWATQNREQLLKLAADSEKADAKALQAAYDAIDVTCEACHKKYRDK
jgi:hypothetical protein